MDDEVWKGVLLLYIFLGHVNDPPADLDKIKIPDLSTVGMLYRRGGH